VSRTVALLSIEPDFRSFLPLTFFSLELLKRDMTNPANGDEVVLHSLDISLLFKYSIE
jgi:hypothetical protein